MKLTAIFVLIFAILVALTTAAAGADLAKARHVRSPCDGESCRATCILNGHNSGSCNSNDSCDCN
ncbi:hypothetical protein NQ315_012678 [Exocentrus adspersus]|uniref:Defensin n=1 Tax=Exocentrus adspersus TaxID=1586481 RepID=A0AAV8VTZ0_9CUCU|nr:hypothetical protein NQ315_012678 [Exocentrus adspersus]